MAEPRSFWVTGVVGIGTALVATLAVRFLGLLVIDVPPEFPPLAGIGPTIFFTTVASVVAVAVYAGLRSKSSNPAATFRWIALFVLPVSFVPDFWLLSDSAAETFPGATPGGVGILMAMHVAAALAIVGVLTSGEGPPAD